MSRSLARRCASVLVATALLGGGLALGGGTASASTALKVGMSTLGVPLACVATGSSCELWAEVTDTATPVTFRLNGTVVGTAMPVEINNLNFADLAWTPQAAGHYVVTAQQGTLSDSFALDIIDDNSVQATFLRFQYALETFDGGSARGHEIR
ncbi:Ig-like domain repeat protein [Rhodococcus spelaei]|uniref:Ig-like domain repeat protein n=1 Tax=Rhodococcus spelaei TaxID=2546320 RepID=A0A541B4E6_9NOCA|nr:Ig-like domain-containing protein [Rhodococcus spelaei]TQF67187.1 Ig-like domain repeat protein [Rhodococcus spelaei]